MSTGSGARGVARIGGAIAVASVAGYALQVGVGQLLSQADYSVFISFWGVLFGIGGALSIVEQEAARQTAMGAREPRPTVRAIAVVAAVVAVVAAAVTLVPFVTDRLYDGRPVLGLIVLASSAGFAAQFAIRGTLVGSDAVRPYAGLIVAEALLRLVVLGGAVALAVVDVPLAGVAVAAGSFAWVGWARRWRAVPGARPSGSQWWPVVRRTLSLMLVAALMASMITGFPAMVSFFTDAGGSADLGVVFAALTVSRVPLLLVSPVQAVAVPAVVRWHGPGGIGSPRLRRRLVLGAGIAATGAVLGAAVAWWCGPAVVHLLYPRYDAPAASVVAVLVASAVVLTWVLLMSAALVALSAYRQATVMWALAVAATALWLLASPLAVVPTAAVGAMVGPLVATGFGFYALWSATAADSVGSPASGDADGGSVAPSVTA